MVSMLICMNGILMNNNEVYFILDKEWNGNLYQTSRNRHVWICNSTKNDVQIKQVWELDNGVSINKGVTSFELNDDVIDEFYDFLPTIDEHHAQWKKIVVFGIPHIEINKTEIEKIMNCKVKIICLENCFKIEKIRSKP